MSIFSYEGKASHVLMRIAESCYLNLLWFVCSLPIVTIGASTTALYYVTLKMAANEEGDIGQQFFRALRANFKQATQVWLILLAFGIVLGLDIYVLWHLRSATTGPMAIFWTILLAINFAIVIAYVVELFFVFPLIARVENDNFSMIKNALLIGTHYLNCTLVVFAIHFAMFFVAVRIFTPILILGEGLVALGSSFMIAPVLRLVTTKPGDDEAEDAAA